MRKALAGALLLGLILTEVAPAWAGPSEEASDLMNQGVQSYSRGNLEAARRSFLAAFELAPHHTIASNLAEVEIKLGRYREASEHLNYVLRSLPPNASEERASSEKGLAQCRERLSVVRVAVSVKGAAVTLDGKSVGNAPLETELWLDPGEYVVEARHSGYEPASERVAVKAGESREVVLALGKSAAPSGTTPNSAAPPDEAEHSPGVSAKAVVLIGGSVLTAAAATVGTVFLLKSSAAGEDADQALAEIKREEPDLWENGEACRLLPEQRPAACATLSQAQQDEETFRNVAIGGFVAAGALGIGTVVTYLLWPDDKASSATPFGRPHRRVSIAPWIDRDARGVTAEFVLP
jgi:tetratricopeptide (TPR) repeat protein